MLNRCAHGFWRDPGCGEAHFGLGHLYLQQGKLKEAEQEFHSARELQLKPEAETDARRHLAEITEALANKEFHPGTLWNQSHSTMPAIGLRPQ